MESAKAQMIPMTELLEIGSEHACNKALFPFVNRALNVMGIKARVIAIGMFVSFVVEKKDA